MYDTDGVAPETLCGGRINVFHACQWHLCAPSQTLVQTDSAVDSARLWQDG